MTSRGWRDGDYAISFLGFGGRKRGGTSGDIDGASFDIFGQGHEGEVDVVVGLGGSFEEFDIVLVGKGLATGSIYNFFILHVALVSDEHLIHRFSGMLLDVADPVADVREGLLVGDVIHQQNSHGSSVIGCRDGTEAFLTRSIPDLQLYLLTIKFNGTNFEINSKFK